jgi:hypothetical protein
MSIVFICDFNMGASVGREDVGNADFVICFRDHIESAMFYLSDKVTQNLMLIHCSKNLSLTFCDAT